MSGERTGKGAQTEGKEGACFFFPKIYFDMLNF